MLNLRNNHLFQYWRNAWLYRASHFLGIFKDNFVSMWLSSFMLTFSSSPAVRCGSCAWMAASSEHSLYAIWQKSWRRRTPDDLKCIFPSSSSRLLFERLCVADTGYIPSLSNILLERWWSSLNKSWSSVTSCKERSLRGQTSLGFKPMQPTGNYGA